MKTELDEDEDEDEELDEDEEVDEDDDNVVAKTWCARALHRPAS